MIPPGLLAVVREANECDNDDRCPWCNAAAAAAAGWLADHIEAVAERPDGTPAEDDAFVLAAAKIRACT